jgi:hypothetical protein
MNQGAAILDEQVWMPAFWVVAERSSDRIGEAMMGTGMRSPGAQPGTP